MSASTIFFISLCRQSDGYNDILGIAAVVNRIRVLFVSIERITRCI